MKTNVLVVVMLEWLMIIVVAGVLAGSQFRDIIPSLVIFCAAVGVITVIAFEAMEVFK